MQYFSEAHLQLLVAQEWLSKHKYYIKFVAYFCKYIFVWVLHISIFLFTCAAQTPASYQFLLHCTGIAVSHNFSNSVLYVGQDSFSHFLVCLFVCLFFYNDIKKQTWKAALLLLSQVHVASSIIYLNAFC